MFITPTLGPTTKLLEVDLIVMWVNFSKIDYFSDFSEISSQNEGIFKMFCLIYPSRYTIKIKLKMDHWQFLMPFRMNVESSKSDEASRSYGQMKKFLGWLRRHEFLVDFKNFQNLGLFIRKINKNDDFHEKSIIFEKLPKIMIITIISNNCL